MHYTNEQLSALLNHVDAGLSDEAVAHLETCEPCRLRLGKLTGEGAWLSDLLDSVGDATCELAKKAEKGSDPFSPPGPFSASVVISVDASDEMNQDIQCDAVRLDFLGAPTHPELLGRLGRYDIERLIGMGGYGIVFKARDSELNRVVAIKVLAPHLMHSGPARQRFAREAQASAAVVHDHVVPIYDVVADSGVSYFVMQYIAGESLQERVDRLGPLPTEDVLRIAAQIAAGLQAAHAQGLIHRDVKPGNVLLEDTVNRVMISDFGLARAADDASLTRSGTITGTPHYMSPEQARGQAIDHRSDLFSLGSVMYFMCTGHSPFRAPQMMAVLNRICHEPYRPIEEMNSGVPVELTRIINRLLDKKPDDRFESAGQVRSELQRLLNDFQRGKLRPHRMPARSFIPKLIAALTVVCLLTLLAFTLPRAWRNAADQDHAAAPLAQHTGSAEPQSAGGNTDIQTARDPQTWLPSDPRAHAFVESDLNVFSGEKVLQEMQGIAQSVEVIERLGTQHLTSIHGGSNWDEEIHRLKIQLQQLEEELGGTTGD